MKELTFEMRECPDCKTLSIPANKVCLNCNVGWIFKSYSTKWVDILIGITLSVLIVTLVFAIIDHTTKIPQ